MPTNTSVIATKDLRKTYGKKTSAFTALNGVDLDIHQGESVAIIGKSGSGKSTLMHLLALLDRPTRGAVLIDDRDATNLKNKELDRLRNRRFGFVFQQFFMNANDSVLNNVILPLKIAGLSKRERREKAMKALAAVELADKAKNKAKDLSGGQKQRVCIARAIVNDPEILFADEPTGNLDSTTGTAVEDLLFNLNRDKNITLIIVTHDDDLAARCDRQIYIRDGKILRETSAKTAAKGEK